MGKLTDAGIDFDELAGHATAALFESASDGEGWDDLHPDEKAAIHDSAVAVVKASLDWMKERGIAFVPPGAFKAPTSREEAQHMMAAGMAWLQSNPAPKALIKPSLVIAKH